METQQPYKYSATELKVISTIRSYLNTIEHLHKSDKGDMNLEKKIGFAYRMFQYISLSDVEKVIMTPKFAIFQVVVISKIKQMRNLDYVNAEKFCHDCRKMFPEHNKLRHRFLATLSEVEGKIIKSPHTLRCSDRIKLRSIAEFQLENNPMTTTTTTTTTTTPTH
jgi:hypothetical protein